MDTLIKPKEKRTSQKLIGVTDYTFISMCSMDQCVMRLKKLEQQYRRENRSFWKGTSLYVETLTDNGGVVNFGIKATGTRQVIEVRAVSQLTYKGPNETLVKMQIGVTRRSLIIDIVISTLIGLIFVLGNMTVSFLVAMLFVECFIHAITFFSFHLLKSELRESVHEALYVPQAPRPATLPR